MSTAVVSQAASATYSPRTYEGSWVAFASPLLLTGVMSGVAIPDDAVRALSRVLGQAVYESCATDISTSAFGLGSFTPALENDASIVAEDFARLALDIMMRQRTIEIEVERLIAAKWHELYE